jgi:site-specific DNA-methyltransferase (adenine-specific)
MQPYYDENQIRLYHGDFRDVLPRLGLQFPLIATDPPYPEKYLPLYGELARLGADCLTEGGSLLAMAGHYHLPAVLNLMTLHLNFHWLNQYTTPGVNARIWHRKVMVGWKPVVWFVKGKYTGKWVFDGARSGKVEKEYHEWGQSTRGMIDLIRRFVADGETPLVLDPFAGGGSTLEACRVLGLPAIGIEIEEGSCEAAAKRLTRKGSAAASSQHPHGDRR